MNYDIRNLIKRELLPNWEQNAINLNGYKHFRFNDFNNGHYELCKYYNVPETVDHYLIDSTGQKNELALKMNSMESNYDACRNILKYKLKRTDSFWKNRANFNVISSRMAT